MKRLLFAALVFSQVASQASESAIDQNTFNDNVREIVEEVVRTGESDTSFVISSPYCIKIEETPADSGNRKKGFAARVVSFRGSEDKGASDQKKVVELLNGLPADVITKISFPSHLQDLITKKATPTDVVKGCRYE